MLWWLERPLFLFMPEKIAQPAARPTEQPFGQARPPVIVVMGHIDHGKTTLLDFIRKSTVAAKESGGITQHIGAYQIEHEGKKVTFLDTPGHEAFSAIRARGAQVADVAVLVVAADEGLKPQTLEALDIIQRAKLPYIVAINKIDKPGAAPDKVKGEFAEKGILLEGWGGAIPVVSLSAVTGEGVETLLETIVLLAEVETLEITERPAESLEYGGASGVISRSSFFGRTPTGSGVIIESSLDQRRGALATLIPQTGTLLVGANVSAGGVSGRIRLMEDAEGKAVTSAPPSFPVRVIGFKEAPAAGEPFYQYSSLKEAETVAEKEKEARKTYEPAVLTLISGKREHILPLILKADVQGSLEGIVQALKTLPIGRVGIEVLRAALGNITDSDIKIAEPKNAIVMGFRIGIDTQARLLAEQRGVSYAAFTLIYELIESVRKRMTDLLPPVLMREDLGVLGIRALFKKTARGEVAGGAVLKGKIKRGAAAEIIRNGQVIGRGKIAQLQHERADVEEVLEGRECGILFEGDRPLATGDSLTVFEEKAKAQEL
jgi:translation initiation factor IF-2